MVRTASCPARLTRSESSPQRGVAARIVSTLSCIALSLLLLVGGAPFASAQPLPYDIVAVRMPRTADAMRFPDVDNMTASAHSELVLIRPGGAVEVLDNPGPEGAIFKAVVSFDGKRVLYSKSPNAVDPGNGGYLFPAGGVDIYEIDLATRGISRITFGAATPYQNVSELDPTTGQPKGQSIVFNVGPCYVPGPNGTEDIVFSSSRHNFHFVKAVNTMHINFQLYRMDRSGRNIRPIDKMDTGDALDCEVLTNGWISYSSAQAQGLKSPTIWGLWSIRPDGTGFKPIISGLRWGASYHFASQLSDGRIVATEYYNGNNFGFGAILAVAADPDPNLPAFGDANPNDPSNPLVRYGWRGDGKPAYTKYTFSPQGLANLTAFTFGSPDDPSNFLPSGERSGKASHPAGAPNNDLLFAYSPGTVNKFEPYVWSQIRLLQGSVAVDQPSGARVIVADPAYNYYFPRAVATFAAIYGIERPPFIPYLPNGRAPVGLVGTASMLNRDVTAGTGVDLGNGQRTTPRGFVNLELSTAWSVQGAETGKYSDDDIYAVRILAMDPALRTNSGAVFASTAPGERLRVIGEIPVRKLDANGNQPKDGDGRDDTSFLATIPADTAFTFQTIDHNGFTLNMAQTWHQIRPGETRVDCGGCHAHAKFPTDFNSTAAANPNYVPWNLADYLTLLTKDENGATKVASFTGAEARRRRSIEYLRDIRPILDRSCVSCHSGAAPAGGLDLSDKTLINGYERTYLCLTNVNPDLRSDACSFDRTRYIVQLQARRSLLAWKIFGRRLDGLTNETFPSEAIPGDRSTFPAGADWQMRDYDYTGEQMPPPGSNAPALSWEEKMLIARWIDLGSGSDPSPAEFRDRGFLADQLGPVLNISSPRAERMQQLTELSFGTFDYLSGVDRSRISVKASFFVNGKPPGTELFPDFTEGEKDVFTLTLAQPLTNLGESDLTVSVFDTDGNKSELTTTFSVAPNGTPPPTTHPIPRGPQPPAEPPGPPPPADPPAAPGPPPTAPGPVMLLMQEGQMNLPMKRDRRGRPKAVKLKLVAYVLNLALSPKEKIQFLIAGQPPLKFAKRASFKLKTGKKGVKKLSYTLTFKQPGSYPLAAVAVYPGGMASRRLTVNVAAP